MAKKENALQNTDNTTPETNWLSERRKKKEDSANQMVEALDVKEQEIGRPLTQQEMSDFVDSKGLFAYQSLNNKKGNWADAFGAHGVFGKLDNGTYKMLRSDLDKRKTDRDRQEADNNKNDIVLGIVTQPDGSTRNITRGQQARHQNFWGQGIDKNDMSPESANQLINILRSDGAQIPNNIGFEDYTTLFNVFDSVKDYVDDDELYALGYIDDNDNLITPHKETFEEMAARRARLEEEMKLQAQQKELERQRLRTGIADFAAGIGDMVKAAGGANVSQRDYQDMYDKLTAQQQLNFNNYLTKMQAMKDAEMEKQKMLEERRYNEKLLREDRKFQEELLDKKLAVEYEKLATKERLQKAKLAAKKAIKDAELQNKFDLANLERAHDSIVLTFDGVKYTYDSVQSKDAVLQSLAPILRNYIVQGDNNRLREPYASLVGSIQGGGIESAQQVQAMVLMALGDSGVINNADLKQKIAEVMNNGQVLYTQQTGTSADGRINIFGEGTNGNETN
jgi:hypothetical protein